MIPCDAACLLRLEGDRRSSRWPAYGLRPARSPAATTAASTRASTRSCRSLRPGALPRRQPAARPVRRPVEDDPRTALAEHIHACVGCALTDGGEVVGALTLDALDRTALRRLRHPLPGDTRRAGRRGAAHHRAHRGARGARREAGPRRARAAAPGGSRRAAGLVGASPALQRLLEEIALVAALGSRRC